MIDPRQCARESLYSLALRLSLFRTLSLNDRNYSAVIQLKSKLKYSTYNEKHFVFVLKSLAFVDFCVEFLTYLNVNLT